ncbi:MAG: hypothetical protein AB9861_05000 [Methanosarcina sp.]|jgi:hypothetical protein
MRMKDHATSGEMLKTKMPVHQIGGEEAAKMIHAAVTIEIYGVRHIVDFGQGWENRSESGEMDLSGKIFI